MRGRWLKALVARPLGNIEHDQNDINNISFVSPSGTENIAVRSSKGVTVSSYRGCTKINLCPGDNLQHDDSLSVQSQRGMHHLFHDLAHCLRVVVRCFMVCASCTLSSPVPLPLKLMPMPRETASIDKRCHRGPKYAIAG